MKNRNIPFGYRFEDGKIVVNPDEQNTLQRICSEYLDGRSLLQIANGLESDKVEFAPGIITWNKARIMRIVDDDRYLGNATYPQVIDEATLERLRSRKASRNTQTSTDRQSGIYLLKVPIICPSCGNSMHRLQDTRCKCTQKWVCNQCHIQIKKEDTELMEDITTLLNALIQRPEIKMGMLEHITNNRKHIYWMHSVIAAAVREQQKEHLYTLSRPFVDILCEELNTGRVFGKEYEKAYLIPFSWSIADIMEKHWCVEDDTDYLTSLFHICFSCSNYILCEKIIDIVIRVQTDNPAFTAEDLAYSYRNKIDLLMQFDKVEEAAPLFKEVERLMSITDLPENKRNILSYQYGIYNQIRGKYDKAREYFRYCIDCAEKEESITREKDISTAYANMARMLVEAGDFFEAYKCIKKAINAEKEDELDSDQIVCYSTLAGICTELMQAGYGTTYIDEAIAAFDKVIKFREKHLGKHHTDTAVIYHDYSYFWYVCGVLDKALEYNEKAYKIDEELFAEHSITRMRTLNTKALIIWDQGDYDKACSTLEYIIKTTEQMGNNYLVDLFDFSFNYARCLHEKGNDTLSKEYYNKCIDIWDSMSGGGSRNLCLVFQEYGDILFSEMNPGEALSKYESALKYNTEDWYIEVDLIDSIAACMMLIGQTDESLQKFAWLLQTLAEDDVKDAETKFQLCNNLACVLNSETEEEIEYKESLFDLVKDDAAVLSYAIHYLDDWLPDSAE